MQIKLESHLLYINTYYVVCNIIHITLSGRILYYLLTNMLRVTIKYIYSDANFFQIRLNGYYLFSFY